jgi:hypothetical protein
MKNNLFLSTKIKVQKQGDRRGVFCMEDIQKGELIEEAPLILPHDNKWENCDKEIIKYAFPWAELREDWKDFCEKEGGILPLHATRPLLVLGYGMVYARSKDHNVDFKVEKKLFTCNFIARCDIKEGEELCVAGGEISKNNE